MNYLFDNCDIVTMAQLVISDKWIVLLIFARFKKRSHLQLNLKLVLRYVRAGVMVVVCIEIVAVFLQVDKILPPPPNK